MNLGVGIKGSIRLLGRYKPNYYTLVCTSTGKVKRKLTSYKITTHTHIHTRIDIYIDTQQWVFCLMANHSIQLPKKSLKTGRQEKNKQHSFDGWNPLLKGTGCVIKMERLFIKDIQSKVQHSIPAWNLKAISFRFYLKGWKEELKDEKYRG